MAEEGWAVARLWLQGRWNSHLLALLNAKLSTDLNALHSVGEEVTGGVLHLVLVEGAGEVPTQEDDSIGQQLRAGQGQAQYSAWSLLHFLTPNPLGWHPSWGRQGN